MLISVYFIVVSIDQIHTTMPAASQGVLQTFLITQLLIPVLHVGEAEANFFQMHYL